MKSIFILLLLVSCGKNEALKTNLRILSDDGAKSDVKKVDNRVDDLSSRVSALELSLNSTILTVDSQAAQLGNLQSQLSLEILAVETEIEALQQSQELTNQEVQDQLTVLESELSDLNQQLVNETNSLQQNIMSLQSLANATQAQLTAHLAEAPVLRMIDPCQGGNFSGYREFIMRTQNNKFYAYFEDGTKRFISELKAETAYQTTDGRGCNFKITNNNQVQQL